MIRMTLSLGINTAINLQVKLQDQQTHVIDLLLGYTISRCRRGTECLNSALQSPSWYKVNIPGRTFEPSFLSNLLVLNVQIGLFVSFYT